MACEVPFHNDKFISPANFWFLHAFFILDGNASEMNPLKKKILKKSWNASFLIGNSQKHFVESEIWKIKKKYTNDSCILGKFWKGWWVLRTLFKETLRPKTRVFWVGFGRVSPLTVSKSTQSSRVFLSNFLQKLYELPPSTLSKSI